MGCAASTEAAVTAKENLPPPKKHEKIKTGVTEIMAISAHPVDTTPPTTRTLLLGNFRFRYSCVSKRGRDPDVPSKPNQDCFSTDEQFCGGAFFGVYDGHGPTGELCASFAQRRMPALTKQYLSSSTPLEASLKKAHMECNDDLHKCQINDSYSGTTAISIYLDDKGRMTVCNIGDSRAILGETTSDTKLQAIPLSNDQTPYRSDEAARCVKAGARILSFGQIDPHSDDDSEVEDPPRVWSKTGKFPGTAFTRSIGDAVAEQLGVFAMPEIVTQPILLSHKLIVLATDGIFDVMENQEVIDLCFQYKDDPVKACNAVIEKSHEEWLLNEECDDEELANYDDMTIICIFIDFVGEDQIGSMTAATNGDEAAAAISNNEDTQLSPSTKPQPREHHKRVRQKTLRNLEEMAETEG